MNSPIETRQFTIEQTGRLLRRVAFQVGRTAKSCDGNAVHDLRVVIRRFTQSIAVSKPCFPGKDIRKIRRRLKKIMAAAGEVRNYDIALQFLANSQSGDAKELQSKLQIRRKDSSRILTGELKRWKNRQLSAKWRAALEAAVAKDNKAFARTAIQLTSTRTLRRMMKDFLKRGDAAASNEASSQDLHRFRILAKKFRYTIEMFGPLQGNSWVGAVESIKRAQTLLGDINDCVTIARLVEQNGASRQLVSQLRKRKSRKTLEFRQYWSDELQASDEWRNFAARLAQRAPRVRGIRKGASTTGSANRKSAAAVA